MVLLYGSVSVRVRLVIRSHFRRQHIEPQQPIKPQRESVTLKEWVAFGTALFGAVAIVAKSLGM